MRRAVTTAEFEELQRAGLSARDFRRAVYRLENGPHAQRLLDLQNRRDVTAKLHRDALGAARARSKDGSLQRYQLQHLAQTFTAWRAAVGALADFESLGRRVPAAAAE